MCVSQNIKEMLLRYHCPVIGGKRVTEIGLKAFENCIDLTWVIIPESVMKIGAFSFKGCKGLRKVLLPSDISDIGAVAFRECKN